MILMPTLHYGQHIEQNYTNYYSLIPPKITLTNPFPLDESRKFYSFKKSCITSAETSSECESGHFHTFHPHIAHEKLLKNTRYMQRIIHNSALHGPFPSTHPHLLKPGNGVSILPCTTFSILQVDIMVAIEDPVRVFFSIYRMSRLECTL